MGNKTEYYKFFEAYEELVQKSKESNDELISFLMNSKEARIICSVEEGELPKGIESFQLNDIQRKSFEKANQLLDSIKEEIVDVRAQQDDELQEVINAQIEEETAKIKARRLEFFTKHHRDLIKLPLPQEAFPYIEKARKDTEASDSFKHFISSDAGRNYGALPSLFYSAVEKNYEVHMNESISTIILPQYTNIIASYCRFDFVDSINRETHEQSIQFTVTNDPHFVSSYEYFKDFLKEYTGEIEKPFYKAEKNHYETYKETLEEGLYYYTNEFFKDTLIKILEDEYNVVLNEEDKEFTLNQAENFLFDSNLQERLVQYYLEILENLPIRDVFVMYDFEDQKDEYEFCLYDEEITYKEKGEITKFINSLKTGSEKTITIHDGQDFFQVFMKPDNKLYNQEEQDSEDGFTELLWDIATEMEGAASLFVKEQTNIKNSSGIVQKKVTGIIIRDSDFIPIPKEELKDNYRSQGQGAEEGLIFYPWYYNFIPSINEIEE